MKRSRSTETSRKRSPQWHGAKGSRFAHAGNADTSRAFVVACLMVGASEGRPRVEIRELGTTVRELETLRDWLCQNACTAVASVAERHDS